MSRLPCLPALLALGALLLARPVQAQADGYLVLVNAANPVTTMSRADVSKLFLRRTTKWPSGTAVDPVDLAEGARSRELFSKQVHGRSAVAIRAFWQQQVFGGRGVPPVEKSNEAQVVELVRANPSAIGYVSPGAELGRGVKVLLVTP
jgi:ABC-type phosphate transport system substrate-binding protein